VTLGVIEYIELIKKILNASLLSSQDWAEEVREGTIERIV
jgi:hypothetical protein